MNTGYKFIIRVHLYESVDFLFNLVNPAFWSFFGSHLNAGESFPEFFEDWADFIHAAWNIDFCSVVIDATNWADYSSCSAQADFYEIFKLVFVNLSLFDFEVKIVACNLNQ